MISIFKLWRVSKGIISLSIYRCNYLISRCLTYSSLATLKYWISCLYFKCNAIKANFSTVAYLLNLRKICKCSNMSKLSLPYWGRSIKIFVRFLAFERSIEKESILNNSTFLGTILQKVERFVINSFWKNLLILNRNSNIFSWWFEFPKISKIKYLLLILPKLY